MNYRKLTFLNESGHTISARLDLPEVGGPDAYAVFAHCFTCTKHLKAVSHISRALTAEGIAVLRFDFTGLGESEGDFSETNFSSNIQDLVSAAEFLEKEFQPPSILIGHSLGGAAVLHAASKIASVKAVATIGAPSDPTHVSLLVEPVKQQILEKGEATVTLAGRSFVIKKQFLKDLEQTRMKDAVSRLKCALILFHSPVDEIVGVEHASQIFQAARHPKSFVSLDKADHLLSNEKDSRYVGRVIAAWARKYVETHRKIADIRDPARNEVLAVIGQNPYRTEIVANGHRIVADEPVSVGGANAGPTPYDLLVAALGACICMTLRMYADRKQWPLDSVKVRLEHRKIHASDCTGCEMQEGHIDQISIRIDPRGGLSREQQERLLDIAGRCPVSRTLQSEIRIIKSLGALETGEDPESRACPMTKACLE
jgi:putative redox protein